MYSLCEAYPVQDVSFCWFPFRHHSSLIPFWHHLIARLANWHWRADRIDRFEYGTTSNLWLWTQTNSLNALVKCQRTLRRHCRWYNTEIIKAIVSDNSTSCRRLFGVEVQINMIFRIDSFDSKFWRNPGNGSTYRSEDLMKLDNNVNEKTEMGIAKQPSFLLRSCHCAFQLKLTMIYRRFEHSFESL